MYDKSLKFPEKHSMLNVAVGLIVTQRETNDMWSLNQLLQVVRVICDAIFVDVFININTGEGYLIQQLANGTVKVQLKTV